jgi:hypothetical protein
MPNWPTQPPLLKRSFPLGSILPYCQTMALDAWFYFWLPVCFHWCACPCSLCLELSMLSIMWHAKTGKSESLWELPLLLVTEYSCPLVQGHFHSSFAVILSLVCEVYIPLCLCFAYRLSKISYRNFFLRYLSLSPPLPLPLPLLFFFKLVN